MDTNLFVCIFAAITALFVVVPTFVLSFIYIARRYRKLNF